MTLLQLPPNTPNTPSLHTHRHAITWHRNGHVALTGSQNRLMGFSARNCGGEVSAQPCESSAVENCQVKAPVGERPTAAGGSAMPRRKQHCPIVGVLASQMRCRRATMPTVPHENPWRGPRLQPAPDAPMTALTVHQWPISSIADRVDRGGRRRPEPAATSAATRSARNCRGSGLQHSMLHRCQDAYNVGDPPPARSAHDLT